MKSGNLNFMGPSGPLQARNGTAAAFYNRDGVCLLRGTDWIFKCNSGYSLR